MNINGVYTSGKQNILDKIPGVVSKESQINTIEKDITSQTISTEIDTDFLTYGQEALKTPKDEQKEEDTSKEDNLDNAADCMSKDDYKAINEEGISIDEYNLERLDLVLQRIKTQRNFKEENLEAQKEVLKQKIDEIDNISSFNGVTKKIVQKLIEVDLPVTEANIIRIANCMEMAAATLQMSDQAMNYLLKNNMEPTIENIYKAQHSGYYAKKSDMQEEELSSLQGQIKQIISNAGLEVNENSCNTAKWLLGNKLPMTETTLWAYKDLEEIKNQIKEEDILDKSVKTMAMGKAPESASLSQVLSQRVLNTIETIDSITDEAISIVVGQKQDNQQVEISCRELQQAQSQLKNQKETQDDIQTRNNQVFPENPYEESTIDIKTVTVRRQLEEIRLKMTVEAGAQLIKKGFHLDTDSISKIIDGLKAIEDQYYENLLKEGNIEINVENTEVLKSSLIGVEELKEMPSYILGSTLDERKTETISGLLLAGTECRQSLDKVNEAYDAVMTKPRADLGDSITKAFQNVDAILEDMQLETTQANERAVRILGYNNIPITDENLTYVKAYDEQVNHLIKNLHPAVAVELIRNGINPLNVPIEELNKQIDEVKSEKGITEEEKYSKYLWKLEKNNSITEEEKKSFIGIYRLLNNVEKTDGAALGAVLKADQEVTMKNLLTAVKTKKSGGVDAAVNDEFGVLTQLSFSREKITDQINTAYNTINAHESGNEQDAGNEKAEYINLLLKDIMEEISPDRLKAIGSVEDILNMSVENFRDELTHAVEDSDLEQTYFQDKLEQFQELAKQGEDALKVLQNYDLPDNIHNIQAATDLLSQENNVFKRWNNLLEEGRENQEEGQGPALEETNITAVSNRLLEALTDPQSIKNQYEAIDKDVNKILNEYYENPVITSRDIGTLQRISYGMSFLGKMAGKESYEIPLCVGENITNVNVTILRNTGESGKVTINLDSDTLGQVSIGLSVKNNELKALITCDNRPGLDAIVDKSNDLNDTIEKNNIEIKQINYGIGNKIQGSNRYNNYKSNGNEENTHNDNTVATKTLYSLAKTFLIHIKQIENNY